MKLVSIHKQLLLFTFLTSLNYISAQETWTLKRCVDTARAYNKSLEINKKYVAVSLQKEKEASANLIPKVNVNADYKYFQELPTQLMPLNIFNPQIPEGQFKIAQFGVPHNINANVQLMMPVYSPLINGAIQTSKIATEKAQLQYQKTEEQVLYDVITLYYNAQILKHQLMFIDSNLVNTKKLLYNMEVLKNQLMAIGTDVSKIKLKVAQIGTQRETVSNNYAQVLNSLKMNMGMTLEKMITVEDNIGFQSSPDYTAKTSLDIQAFHLQNRLLNAEIGVLNKLRLLPSVNLIASYGTAGFGYDKKPNDFLKFYPIGFGGLHFSYSIFDGTVKKRKLNQKKLELSINELQSQLVSDKLELEISYTGRRRDVSQQTVINSESQIDLAQTIYSQTIIQLKQGTASLTDVILADNSLREAQQNYLTAVIDYLKADLELKKLNGVLSDSY